MKYCPQCTADFETRLVDGVERQICSANDCGFVVWDNPVPVVAGLVAYQGEMLLARNSAWPKGMFSLIAGYLERHEAPAEAIVREVKEEIGLDTCDVKFLGHYPLIDKNQLIIAYALKTEGNINLNHEIAEIEMLNIDQLRQKDFGELGVTSRIVTDWLNNL